MRHSIIIIACILLVLSSQLKAQTISKGSIEMVFPGEKWLTIQPEKVGFSPEKLELARIKFAASGGLAMLIVVNGYIIGDWGDTDQNIECRSIRKSLINSIYGIYVEKSIINLNNTLSDININDKSKLTPNELKTKIKYLLSSSSGIYLPAAFEEEVNRNKPERETHKPGEKFVYNNWSFNVLSTIFNQLTNVDLFSAFSKQIATPLQMEHFDFRYNTAYLYQKELSDHPAYLFQISTKDLARYGLLYLNGGKWNNKQLIPGQWVIESTSKQIKTGEKFYYDYGYLWWVSKQANENYRPPFLARGAQSQYMYIDPANNLIIVFRDNPESTIKVSKFKGYSLIGSVYSAIEK